MLRTRQLVFNFVAVSFFVGASVDAQTLSNRAIYERCFAKLVRTTPADNDPLALAVAAGTKTGPQACKDLLNLAKFTGSGQIPAYTSAPEKYALAQNVLHSMNDLHNSWFVRKKFESSNTCMELTTMSLIDPMEPALFMTRALFSASHKFDSIVTSQDHIRALRTVDVPTRSIQSVRIVGPFNGYPANQKMVGNGGLIGIEMGYNPSVTLTSPKAPTETAAFKVTGHKLFENLGGGIIGSQAYILNNFGDDSMMFPDLEKMPRLWSKYVFEDLLCRQLPVIKEGDALKYEVCPTCAIKPTTAQAPHVLPFRQSRSCVQCHASMDQLLGGVRNLRGGNSGRCNFNSEPAPDFSSYGWFKQPPTKPKNYSWGFMADPDYRKHPSTGKFLYRTYNDKLVDKDFDNLQQLGQILADTNDLYICAAKRYYRYFTGVDADITPMTDAQVEALPADRKFYRKRVINLGMQLKSTTALNKDPLKLIEAIFDLPEYKKKDFNLETVAGQ